MRRFSLYAVGLAVVVMVCVPGFAHATNLTTSLASYWKLNETSGTRADSVGANNLTPNGTGGVGSGVGVVGNAASFVPANSQFLSVPSDGSLNPGAGSFTVATWVNLNSLGTQDILGKWDVGNNKRQYILFYDGTTNNRFSFVVSNNGTSIKQVLANNLGLPTINTWYFIVASYDSVAGTINVQVNNGTANSLADTLGVYSTTTPFQIGARVSPAGTYLDGRVDEAGYWNRVLTPAEITQLYNSGSGLSYPFGITLTTPVVTTGAPTLLASTSMVFNGSITSDGQASSTSRGFAWGTNSGLTTGTATTTELGTFGISSFSTTTIGLFASTTYYYRAYATNTQGTGYGSIVSTTTPASSTPLSIGSASLTAAAATTLTLNVGTASGGSGAYGYQWYRSDTPQFTPGPVNLLSGAVSTTLIDTPPSNGPWFYKCIVTDTNNATTTSNQTAGTLENPIITNNSVSGSLPTTLSILGIGDSITFGFTLSAGQDPITQMGLDLANMFGTRSVTVTNQGHNGASTADWLPGAPTGYLTDAVTAAQAASPAATIAVIMLGANDSHPSYVSSTTYASNMSTIINYLLAHGISKVIVNDPTYIPPGAGIVPGTYTEQSTLLARQYIAQLPSLINGTTILSGDHTAYSFFQDNENLKSASDHVHPTATGAMALGMMWATAVVKALGITLTPITSLAGVLNSPSATTTISLDSWASTGSQTLTLASNNSSDIIATSTGSALGNTTITLPIGASLLPFTLARPITGTSLLSVSNGQGWANPAVLSFAIPDTSTANNAPLNAQAGVSGQSSRGVVPHITTTATTVTAPPYSYTRNLTLGTKGEDVRALQKYLNTHGFVVAVSGAGSPGNETNYFGPATHAALLKFQNAHAHEILAPSGLTYGTGYFGVSTRAYIAAHP